MSIIEKALDKSEDKGTPGEKSPRERSRPAPRGSALTRESALQQDFAGAHPAPRDATRTARSKNRPEFPRHTLKKVTINPKRLDAAGIISPESNRVALVEQFRAIKRLVLMKASPSSNARVPNGNLVLVTSAIPGEGKTFTAINLAMSIAMELDHTVLLVDADAAKSDVSRMFGLKKAKGLTDYLFQPERALSEFLVNTDIEKLTLLPAGHPRANATELFASEHMRNLADQLGGRYTDRIVVIDSPPLLAVSGASVLAHLVGQTVFVVEAIRTPQGAVEEALAQLDSVRNVGLVLNKSRSQEGISYQYGSTYASNRDIR